MNECICFQPMLDEYIGKYTISRMVPKNLPDQYQNCNTSQVLRFGGYHKRRSLCLRSTRPIIWSLHYSPDGLGGLCTPWGRHIPIGKKARQWKTLNPQPSIVAQCSFETLVELEWSDCGMSLEHNASFSRWTWRIIMQTMMEAHLVKRPDRANNSRLVRNISWVAIYITFWNFKTVRAHGHWCSHHSKVPKWTRSHNGMLSGGVEMEWEINLNK